MQKNKNYTHKRSTQHSFSLFYTCNMYACADILYQIYTANSAIISLIFLTFFIDSDAVRLQYINKNIIYM